MDWDVLVKNENAVAKLCNEKRKKTLSSYSIKNVWHSLIFNAHLNDEEKKHYFLKFHSLITCIVFFSIFSWFAWNLMISTWIEKRMSQFLVIELSQNDPMVITKRERERKNRQPVLVKNEHWITILHVVCAQAHSTYSLPRIFCFYYLLIMVFRFEHNYMSLYLMVNLSENHFRASSSFR